jgi:hypothetical protein
VALTFISAREERNKHIPYPLLRLRQVRSGRRLSYTFYGSLTFLIRVMISLIVTSFPTGSYQARVSQGKAVDELHFTFSSYRLLSSSYGNNLPTNNNLKSILCSCFPRKRKESGQVVENESPAELFNLEETRRSSERDDS